MSEQVLQPAPALIAPKRVTAVDVCRALRRRFCAPEWALLFEVGDATGARHTRFTDAVAMSLWPSRGLELYGMEIKVSRSDWRSERANPEKAETIAAYCDRWSLVTGPGVVESIDEIPPAWGWILCEGERLTTQKEPARTDAKVCDRRFLAALLRRASTSDGAHYEAEVAARMEANEADFQRRVDRAVEMRLGDRDAALKDIEAFEAAAGIQISEFRGWASSAAETGRAVSAVMKSGVDQTYQGLQHCANTLRESAGRIEEALEALNLPAAPKPTSHKRRRGSR
ncbi:hypothetical protein [Methylorubrum thiocyanatum]|uniref:Uncharacterized protein n=1 Tax=Methylorubrum thiocyanatum TaxID=47958 RepID=A0AA40S087_9HYPH|nr:hypothetical protein [Methylorubrum thiocyanatum]MBA8912049.1 hypothetical protein [Methylorubrum thiocyanatum]GJE79658.1 hypothetical protein CJNNKLLH_0984 [Methylorubrum thiocyanatum]